VSNPATGAQKLIDIEDDKKLRPFMDKRISQEVDASCLGDEWKVSQSRFRPKQKANSRTTYTLNTFLHFGSLVRRDLIGQLLF
jgi:hypothetical protein